MLPRKLPLFEEYQPGPLSEAKSGHQAIPNAIIELINDYKKHGTKACDINAGQCMNFAEDLHGRLEAQGIDVEVLSDGLFFDPYGDTPQDELLDPKDYGSTPTWDYVENGLPSHYWVYYKGMHYDSDSPGGVNNFFKLKTLQDYHNKYK